MRWLLISRTRASERLFGGRVCFEHAREARYLEHPIDQLTRGGQQESAALRLQALPRNEQRPQASAADVVEVAQIDDEAQASTLDQLEDVRLELWRCS